MEEQEWVFQASSFSSMGEESLCFRTPCQLSLGRAHPPLPCLRARGNNPPPPCVVMAHWHPLSMLIFALLLNTPTSFQQLCNITKTTTEYSSFYSHTRFPLLMGQTFAPRNRSIHSSIHPIHTKGLLVINCIHTVPNPCLNWIFTQSKMGN